MSNSNLSITKYSVDPTSQELASVEINGANFSTGEDFDADKLTFSRLESMPVGTESLADFTVIGAEANFVYYGVYYDSDYIGYITAGVRTASPQP